MLGSSYNVAIDMWSLGCVAAELYLGLPLFPGASEHDLLVRVVETLGSLPTNLLLESKNSAKFFKRQAMQVCVFVCYVTSWLCCVAPLTLSTPQRT